MRLLICVVLPVVLSVKLCACCNKEWLKFMVVEACTYNNKRRTPFDGLRKEMTTWEFEYQFAKIYGKETYYEENPWDYFIATQIYKEDEGGGARKRGKREASLVDAFYIGQLAGLQEGWVSEDELLGRPLSVRRRHIKDLIQKCCRTVCTVEDFKGVCF